MREKGKTRGCRNDATEGKDGRDTPRPPLRGGEGGVKAKGREAKGGRTRNKVRAGARTLFYIRQTWRMQEGDKGLSEPRGEIRVRGTS